MRIFPRRPLLAVMTIRVFGGLGSGQNTLFQLYLLIFFVCGFLNGSDFLVDFNILQFFLLILYR